MYQLFEMEKRNREVVGYHYPCEDPNHVVCLIHGIGEHAGRFQRVAHYFNQAGFAVVSMDLRGHGRSQGVRGHCAPREEVLKDIDALIEYAQEFYPNVPIAMYGHSMGGNITLDYRSRGGHNDVPAGYVISAPWIRLVRPVTGLLYQVVKLMSKVAPKMTIESACAEEDLGNVEYVRPYNDDPMVHSKISMLCAYQGFTIGRALEQGSQEDNGRAKKIPCLLMHGDSDKICSVEGSRNFAKLQDPAYFTYIEWPGYYHEIHNGGPKGQTGEEVIKAAIQFISGL
ncbi:MAG: alpha/beta hydrolase [Firmicutes bacterium]|jgi:acylglycerol lipase|nr:alpha/beta hydrolase [Bacillota bacterium]